MNDELSVIESLNRIVEFESEFTQPSGHVEITAVELWDVSGDRQFVLIH